MQINISSDISQIPADEWNNLVQGNNPFLRHEFLYALEKHGCVSEEFGWHPCHISIVEEFPQKDEKKLIAVMPLYAKTNSYGEFVFDHAWAEAYRRNDLPYYPKLVSSIPYAPVSGQRLLCKKNKQAQVFPLLIETVKQLSESQNYSGFHCLFPDSDEQ